MVQATLSEKRIIMFERLSFSLSRIFRLPSRRGGTKANAGSARVARRSTSEPSPSKSRRLVVSQLEPINATLTPSTTRSRSIFIPSILSPIAQSPITPSPGVTFIPDTLTPIPIIGQDPGQSTLPPPTAPALPGDIGPQTHVDPSMPTYYNTRRVSFQFPTTRVEERTESALSTCSTFVPDEAEAERPAVPSEQFLASGTSDSGSVPPASVEPDVGPGLDNVVCSGLGRARPASLFSPQPVRMDVGRFSLPVTPTTPRMTASTNGRDSRRKSKHKSLMSLISGSGSVKKEKRTFGWSRELNKPETQEVLRVLRGL